MGVGGQRHAPAALPPEKTRYPLYGRLGGPQGRSGRVRKISTTLKFDPRTVWPVANRYTDLAIPAHIYPPGIQWAPGPVWTLRRTEKSTHDSLAVQYVALSLRQLSYSATLSTPLRGCMMPGLNFVLLL
jgi:hypothetical protein